MKETAFRGPGDIMAHLYSKPGRIFTGFFASLVCINCVGGQSMALGLMIQRFFDMPPYLGILVGSITIMIYSIRGGIKAVTTTDVLQFAVLIIAIPLLCNFTMLKVDGFDGVVAAVPASHMSFFPNKSDLLKCLGYFLLFTIPGLHPVFVQRMMMGKSLKDAKKSFLISGIIHIPFFAIITLLGLAALALHPSLDANIALSRPVQKVY